MVQEQVFLKGWHFGYLSLLFLHVEITLLFAELCYAFEERRFFLPP